MSVAVFHPALTRGSHSSRSAILPLPSSATTLKAFTRPNRIQIQPTSAQTIRMCRMEPPIAVQEFAGIGVVGDAICWTARSPRFERSDTAHVQPDSSLFRSTRHREFGALDDLLNAFRSAKIARTSSGGTYHQA